MLLIFFTLDNSPPKDSFSRVIQDYQLPVGLQWTVTVLALIGITLAIGLLIFNVYYRNEK